MVLMRKARSAEDYEKIYCQVAEHIEHGLTIDSACRAANVHPATYYKHKSLAKDGQEPWLTYMNNIENAFDRGQAEMAKRVFNHSKKDWKAASWILERRHNDVWGKKDLSLQQVAYLKKHINEMTEEELDKHIKDLKDEDTKD